MFYLPIGAKLSAGLPAMGSGYSLIDAPGSWTLLGVCMLCALIAFVMKLADPATVVPGVTLFAFGCAT